MKRPLIIGAAAVLALGLAFTATTWVSAQTPGPGRGPRATPTANQPYAGGAMHEEMEEAIAGALGITHDELEAALAAGRTVPQLAQERGVDFATVQAAMQKVHEAYGMPGPGPQGTGMMGGQGKSDRSHVVL